MVRYWRSERLKQFQCANGRADFARWLAMGWLYTHWPRSICRSQVRVVDFRVTETLTGFISFHDVDVDTLKFAAAAAQKVEAGSGVFA